MHSAMPVPVALTCLRLSRGIEKALQTSQLRLCPAWPPDNTTNPIKQLWFLSEYYNPDLMRLAFLRKPCLMQHDALD